MYIKYFIYSIAIILITGCNMHKSNSMNFNFFKAGDFTSESNVSINLTLTSQYLASEWYPYQKKITVMRDSELLVDSTTENNIIYTSIEVFNLEQSLYSKIDSDNIYSNLGVDVYEKYQFSNEYCSLSVGIEGEENRSVSKVEYSKKTNPPNFDYYDPSTAEYTVYPLSDDRIRNISQFYTYEELKNSGKLLEADILKIEKLTVEQIQELIIIHRSKDFKTI